jgi:hypothetical protein
MANPHSGKLATQLRLEGAAAAATGGSPTGASAARDEQLSKLARTIEAEIVPRFLMSLTLARRAMLPHPALESQPNGDDVVELARLLLAHDDRVANAYVQIMRDHGTAIECLWEELLTPVAWRLGELWEREECDSEELAAGLTRLESIMREICD